MKKTKNTKNIVNPNILTSPPISPTSCWFFLKNSEMVKYVTIACPSIELVQLVFIRDIHAKFGISNSP